MRWILVIVVIAAAFGFWYGYTKKTEADMITRQNDSIKAVNHVLVDSLIIEGAKRKALTVIADSLVIDIAQKKANLILIGQKYEKYRNTYKHLPADSSIRVLSGYIARERSRWE